MKKTVQVSLAVKDSAVMAKMPWAEYREGVGGDYKRWRALSVL